MNMKTYGLLAVFGTVTSDLDYQHQVMTNTVQNVYAEYFEDGSRQQAEVMSAIRQLARATRTLKELDALIREETNR